MRDQHSWSIGLGRWWGVHVRLHMLLLLFAAFTFYLCWLYSRSPIGAGPDSLGLVWFAAASLLVLLASVVLHELGHHWIAVQLGGGSDTIVLGPLGGMAVPRTPGEPQGELAVHLAGPLTNLVLCAVAVPPLLILDGSSGLVYLLHPWMPRGLTEGPLTHVVFKLAFWINWVLCLVNLLPVYPFDGGRIVRAAILSARPQVGRRRAALIVSTLAKLAAVLVGIIALLWRGDTTPTVFPTWFALILLAIFLYFSARYEDSRQEEPPPEEDLFGYDFSQGYTSLERTSESTAAAAPPSPPVPWWTRWWRQYREQRRRQRAHREAEEEQRVDEILERLHAGGMASLSADDRALLERVSARYRKRSGQGA